MQGTKKLVSDSPGLVDFAVRLVDFTLNLPKGQVKALGEIFFEEIQARWKIELLCTLVQCNLFHSMQRLRQTLHQGDQMEILNTQLVIREHQKSGSRVKTSQKMHLLNIVYNLSRYLWESSVILRNSTSWKN